MVEISVKRAFILNLGPKQGLVSVAAGIQDVPEEIASHPYVKAHLDGTHRAKAPLARTIAPVGIRSLAEALEDRGLGRAVHTSSGVEFEPKSIPDDAVEVDLDNDGKDDKTGKPVTKPKEPEKKAEAPKAPEKPAEPVKEAPKPLAERVAEKAEEKK